MNLRLIKAPGIASPLHVRFTPASPVANSGVYFYE